MRRFLRQCRYALEDVQELYESSLWINIGTTLLVLGGWYLLVMHLTHTQTFNNPFFPNRTPVHPIAVYVVPIAAVWMFLLGWHTLVFVFRMDAVRLRAYWFMVIAGLAMLAFLYGLHFVAGVLGTLIPLRNQQYRNYLVGKHTRSGFVRGGYLLSFAKAERYYRKLRPRDDPGVLWGGIRIPTHKAVTNFMVIGTVGSGKTLSIRLLLQSFYAPSLDGDDADE